MYMRIHISLLNCRGAEKMPARPCPIRSVRSAPVPWAQDARTGRTGPDRTGRDPRSPHLFLFEKQLIVAPKQAFGPKVMECCFKTTFWTKSDGVLLQSNILLQKLWRVDPKHVFAPKVMQCCSKASFCSKSDGALLQNKLLLQKSCSKTSFCSKSDGELLQNKNCSKSYGWLLQNKLLLQK